MNRPSRRTILKVITLLAAGAALNVAVAWGFCVTAKTFKQTVDDLTQTEVQQLRDRGMTLTLDSTPFFRDVFMHGKATATGVTYLGRMKTYKAVQPYSDLHRSPTIPIDVVLEAGWPFMTLATNIEGIDAFNGRTLQGPFEVVALRGIAGFPGIFNASYSWAVPLPDWFVRASGGRCTALPLRPLWPGFAINTLFYTAVVWMLLAIPFALRRRLRIRRGRCPACAYPVGTSPQCTECGASVNPKAASA